ncbi:hypothetical protein FHETE_5943 [Fusarium heterosporum]|uniref:Uncharacterized protein n=1 Tax=Fusarium heterosporum TaxID=42747 RepID=A0A8H5T7T7_FUSHE|nr:hypothetical protein FHETE_5943 [Fusarium heterosporum]
MEMEGTKEHMKSRMEELDAEMTNLRIQIWAFDVDPEPHIENAPESLSSWTPMDTPVSSRENSIVTLSNRNIAGDEHESISINNQDDMSTVAFGRTIHSEHFESARSMVSSLPNGNFSNDPTNPLPISDDNLQVAEVQDNAGVNNPESPYNTSNPHPTLSISIEFLHKAIIDSRKPGNRFERSLLYRERIDTPEFCNPDSVLNGVYTDWTWIPFLISGNAADLVPTNISEGDIELICIKNTTFVEMIENNETMFENPKILLEPSVLVDQLRPNFEVPEAYGLRVMAWRVHGSDESCYMDREGHPIPGPFGLLPQQMMQIKD